MTYRTLDGRGVEYEVVDVTLDEEAFTKITEMGYLQVPVVITPEGEHWSGFRPDKIETIVV